jgi:hypothetical protein
MGGVNIYHPLSTHYLVFPPKNVSTILCSLTIHLLFYYTFSCILSQFLFFPLLYSLQHLNMSKNSIPVITQKEFEPKFFHNPNWPWPSHCWLLYQFLLSSLLPKSCFSKFSSPWFHPSSELQTENSWSNPRRSLDLNIMPFPKCQITARIVLNWHTSSRIFAIPFHQISLACIFVNTHHLTFH